MEKSFNLTINNEIIGSCISVQENENIYEINDVFVKEEYRGKGYGYKLLINVIEYYKKNGGVIKVNGEININIMLKICTEITNIPAVNLYKKIFGDAYRSDSRYYYFSICL
jgi:GNAT superfamily N-acetyltransferase